MKVFLKTGNSALVKENLTCMQIQCLVEAKDGSLQFRSFIFQCDFIAVLTNMKLQSGIKSIPVNFK